MVVGASNVERVCAFEPKDDSELVVHAHRVEAATMTRERVQPNRIERQTYRS